VIPLLLVILCWGDPEMPLCVEPPSPLEQQLLFIREATKAAEPCHESSLFNRCGPYQRDM
jgi:hypothetical protein